MALRRWQFAGPLLALALAACGGGGGGTGPGTPTEPGDTRGTLVSAQLAVGTLAASALGAGASCDVQVWSLHYRTPGTSGAASDASAALLMPAGACASHSHPLVAFARSTEVHRPRTLASLADPDSLLLARNYAAQGYAVVAIDYLGYAQSTHAFHPYLHAESEATTIVDAIRAARRAVAGQGGSLSGRVFLAGYSQGAHATMAAQRTIEASHANEIALTAAAHMAGSYNLSGLLARGDAPAGVQYFLPFLVTSWQKMAGTMYSDVRQVFRDPYAASIESLLPSPTQTFESLRASGALPGSEFTPVEARALLFQAPWLQSTQADANHPMLAMARQNDLIAWSLRARTLLCGGSADPTVDFALHQGTAKAEFDRRGLAQVTSIDVDPEIRAQHGPQPNLAAYHTHLVPPLCHAHARALFDPLR